MARPESAVSFIVNEAIGGFNCKSPTRTAVRFCGHCAVRPARRVRPLGVGVQGALMIPRLGLPEILVILAIVILIFGANRLPELGRGVGKGIRNFKDSMRDGSKEKDA